MRQSVKTSLLAAAVAAAVAASVADAGPLGGTSERRQMLSTEQAKAAQTQLRVLQSINRRLKVLNTSIGQEPDRGLRGEIRAVRNQIRATGNQETFAQIRDSVSVTPRMRDLLVSIAANTSFEEAP